jgi:hypothetical protein
MKVTKQNNLKMTWSGGKLHVSGTLHAFPCHNMNSFTKTWTVKKPKGRLSSNNFLYLFTGKNQWEYLLKRDKNGKWTVYNSMRASAGWIRHGASYKGYVHNGFSGHNYIRTQSITRYGVMAQIENTGYNNTGLYGTRTVLHGEQNAYKSRGTLCSHGCTHLGNYSNKIYYDTMVTAGLGTRAIFF